MQQRLLPESAAALEVGDEKARDFSSFRDVGSRFHLSHGTRWWGTRGRRAWGGGHVSGFHGGAGVGDFHGGARGAHFDHLGFRNEGVFLGYDLFYPYYYPDYTYSYEPYPQCYYYPGTTQIYCPYGGYGYPYYPYGY